MPLSGLVMVTAGVFILVYNADILLPAVGALGSRFGKIVPAVKTGVAYPLTSRFRTGMTMAMIGLIMFALVMNATINRNFRGRMGSPDAEVVLANAWVAAAAAVAGEIVHPAEVVEAVTA